MKHILLLVKWLFHAAVFFTLFAFALNNQQETTVHFFFGNQWHAPQVLVVLGSFALGVGMGVLGMVPWLWHHRRQESEDPPVPMANVNTFSVGSAVDAPHSDGI